MDSNLLPAALKPLQIPSEFARHSTIEDFETIQRLETWKNVASQILNDLRDLVADRQLSVAEQADVVASVVPFDSKDIWSSSQSQILASEILSKWNQPDVHVLTEILARKAKPLFQSSPHPQLHLSTGRKLPRPAGGPMASQDYYESQTWKEHPGAANLIFWCLRHVKSEDYEQLWHLVIPPVMTFLDDYESKNKICGVQLARELLERVPPELLRRTGVDGLLHSSLNTCLGFLRDSDSPLLLSVTIPTTVSLIKLTSPIGSAGYFDQLCTLLGEGIIGTVWMYSSDSEETILASIDSLPPVFNALGLGCVRYLKALIPQLTHSLMTDEFRPPSISLQISSLRALCALIDVCAIRIRFWKGTILDAVVRCWVKASNDDDLRELLQTACWTLSKACPSVKKDEFARLLEADQVIFQELVQKC